MERVAEVFGERVSGGGGREKRALRAFNNSRRRFIYLDALARDARAVGRACG